MTEYISRAAALNFEAEIDADPDEIQAISRGMALYAEHIKALPAVQFKESREDRLNRALNTAALVTLVFIILFVFVMGAAMCADVVTKLMGCAA